MTDMFRWFGFIDPTPFSAIGEATGEATLGNKQDFEFALLGIIPFTKPLKWLRKGKTLLKGTPPGGGHLHHTVGPDGIPVTPRGHVGETPSIGGGTVPSLQGNIPQADKWIRGGGRVIYHTDGSMTFINKSGVSIRYNSVGHPDFSHYLYKGGPNDVEIKLSTESSKATRHRHDQASANKAAGYTETPTWYTWHHHAESGRMQLVKEDVHAEFYHSGGMSISNK